MEMASSVPGMDMNTSQMRMITLSDTPPFTAEREPSRPPNSRLQSMEMSPTESEMRVP